MKDFDFNGFCEAHNVPHAKLGIEMLIKHMHEHPRARFTGFVSERDHTYREISTLEAAEYESQVMPVLTSIDTSEVSSQDVIWDVGYSLCLSALVLSKFNKKIKKHWLDRNPKTVTRYAISYVGAIERLLRSTCGDEIANKFIVEYRTWEIKCWDESVEALKVND